MWKHILLLSRLFVLVALVAFAALLPLGERSGQADLEPTPPEPYLPQEEDPPRTVPGQPEWAPSSTPVAPAPTGASERSAGREQYGPIPLHQPEPPSDFVADQLLVRFRAGLASKDRRAVHAGFGATEAARVERLDLFRVQLPVGSDVPALARAYESHPLVELAQPNYSYSTFVEPSDPTYVDIQHWYYRVTNAPAGWDIETGDASVIVAVVDSGVDLTHPDLDDQIWVNPGETPGDEIDNDGNGCIDDVNGCNFVPSTPNGNPDDDFGHGTFVSGTVCGETNNGVAGAGTAFDCTIMPVKVLDDHGFGSSAGIADGIVYAAENGANIINLSLGTFCFPGEPPFVDPLMEAALATAHDTFGVTIVAAAGNNGGGCVSYPGSDPNTIGVGASGFLNAADGRALFSQWGPEIDVAAPGVDIVGPVPPELCGFIGICRSDGITAIASGTSFSTPQVAGLAVLLLSQEPTRTNEELRTIMRDSALDLPDGTTPNWDGAGRIDVGGALGVVSVFAQIDVGHGFPPVLQLTVGVGDPAAPACEAVLVDFVPLLTSRVNGSFGFGECASSWPPTSDTPWFLKAVDDDLFPDGGNIAAWNLRSAGQLCTAFDTPVAIPDDDPAGGVSFVECLQVAELIVAMSPPATVLQGDQIEYEIEVINLGGVTASPVIVEDPLPAETKLSGPPPAGCSLDVHTVTCDLGSLGSGESTTVVLTVDTNSSGLITNCVTVDPANQIDEPNEGNNTDCDETEIIAVPPVSFSNPDPVGDVFGFGVSPPDIIDIRGAFDADTFYLTVEFADPVDPADAGTSMELGGYIDFDTDQNPDTGFSSTADFYCFSDPNLPPDMQGSDVSADLFSVFNGSVPFFGAPPSEIVAAAHPEPDSSAPIFFAQRAFTIFIPLSVLGGNDSFDFTMVLGSFFGPSDCAPNGTIITCSAGVCEKAPPPPPPEIPANDDFLEAKVITVPLSPPFSMKQNTEVATVEPGEPQACSGIGNTVWYSFTPSSNLLLVADSFGSDYNTTIAVYTGDTLGTLDNVACNDRSGGFDSQSQVAFAASAGVTYHFQAGGSFGASGNLVFNLSSRLAPTCAPADKPGSNSGFDAGPLRTNLIPCWTVVDQADGFGSWCNQAGTRPPQGWCAGSFMSVLSPPAGIQAAMTNSVGPGSRVLYRCGEVESGLLSFQLYLNNAAGVFSSPLSLDYRRIPNQQFRADLVTAAGIAADPFTLDPADILLNVYQTQPDDATVASYAPVMADVSAYVGQEVCLRFAEVDNQFFFLVGVDDVHFETAKDPSGDTDGDTIPNDADFDDDNDGCTDVQELGLNPALGGERNAHNFWDFFDVPVGGLPRDGAVNSFDIGAVVLRFGAFVQPSPTNEEALAEALTPPPDMTSYHAAFDRGSPIPGQNLWNLLPPDGSISAFDIGAVVVQLGHTCA